MTIDGEEMYGVGRTTTEALQNMELAVLGYETVYYVQMDVQL